MFVETVQVYITASGRYRGFILDTRYNSWYPAIIIYSAWGFMDPGFRLHLLFKLGTSGHPKDSCYASTQNLLGPKPFSSLPPRGQTHAAGQLA
jgi:hypothetical protein